MLRVIIADDEETIRNGLQKLISESDLDIKVEAKAENGKQVLELTEKYRPELLLLDINMPKVSGLDIIEKVKELVPLCKIIIISGYDDFQYAQRAIKLGVFDYLLKPVNIATLRATLNRAIEEYKKRLWEINCVNQITSEKGESPQSAACDALTYINENYANPELSLTMVAEKSNISSSYLTRLIKQRTGLSFSDYLTELRINQAKQLLSGEKQHMIYEIASMVGYSSQHYFCKIFKENTGMSPSDYRLLKQG